MLGSDKVKKHPFDLMKTLKTFYVDQYLIADEAGQRKRHFNELKRGMPPSPSAFRGCSYTLREEKRSNIMWTTDCGYYLRMGPPVAGWPYTLTQSRYLGEDTGTTSTILQLFSEEELQSEFERQLSLKRKEEGPELQHVEEERRKTIAMQSEEAYKSLTGDCSRMKQLEEQLTVNGQRYRKEMMQYEERESELLGEIAALRSHQASLEDGKQRMEAEFHRKEEEFKRGQLEVAIQRDCIKDEELEESRKREEKLRGEKADTEQQRQTLEDEKARVQTELDVSKREEERLVKQLDEVEQRNIAQNRELSEQRREYIDMEQRYRQKMEDNDHWIMMAAFIGGAVLLVVGYTVFVLSRRTFNQMADDFKWQLNEQRKEMKQPHPLVPVYPSAHANRLGVHEHPAVRDVFGMKEPWDVTAGEGLHVSRVTGGQKTTRGMTRWTEDYRGPQAQSVDKDEEPLESGKDYPERLSVVIGIPPRHPEVGADSEITEVPDASENDGENAISCEHADRLRVNQHQWPAVRDALGIEKSYDVTNEEGFQAERITRTDSVQRAKLDSVPGVPQNEGLNGNEAEDDQDVQMLHLMENLDI